MNIYDYSYYSEEVRDLFDCELEYQPNSFHGMLAVRKVVYNGEDITEQLDLETILDIGSKAAKELQEEIESAFS